MSTDDSDIREWARQRAAEAPELTDQQWQHLDRLLRPTADSDAETPQRAS